MPSMQENAELFTWVESLPRREGLKNYDEVLKACAERYGNRPGDLNMVMDSLVDTFQKSMGRNIRKYRQLHDRLPDQMQMEEMFRKSFMAVLLRMWTYSSEYYQRYQADKVFRPINDEDLAQFFINSRYEAEGPDANED